MTIMVINMSQRIIDKLLPQQHKEITEAEAKKYKRLFSEKDMKVIEIKESVTKAEEVAPASVEKEEVAPVAEVTLEEVVPTEVTLEDVDIQSSTEPIANSVATDDEIF